MNWFATGRRSARSVSSEITLGEEPAAAAPALCSRRAKFAWIRSCPGKLSSVVRGGAPLALIGEEAENSELHNDSKRIYESAVEQ